MTRQWWQWRKHVLFYGDIFSADGYPGVNTHFVGYLVLEECEVVSDLWFQILFHIHRLYISPGYGIRFFHPWILSLHTMNLILCLIQFIAIDELGLHLYVLPYTKKLFPSSMQGGYSWVRFGPPTKTGFLTNIHCISIVTIYTFWNDIPCLEVPTHSIPHIMWCNLSAVISCRRTDPAYMVMPCRGQLLYHPHCWVNSMWSEFETAFLQHGFSISMIPKECGFLFRPDRNPGVMARLIDNIHSQSIIWHTHVLSQWI